MMPGKCSRPRDFASLARRIQTICFALDRVNMSMCRLIGLMLIFVVSPADACSRYVGITMIFKENSATLIPDETARLSKWVDHVKEHYPRNNGILLVPGAETTESDARQLARRRELAVRLALIDLNLATKDVFVPDEIHPMPHAAWGPRQENDIKRVTIQYFPDSREFYEPCVIENKK